MIITRNPKEKKNTSNLYPARGDYQQLATDREIIVRDKLYTKMAGEGWGYSTSTAGRIYGRETDTRGDSQGVGWLGEAHKVHDTMSRYFVMLA